MTNLLYQGRFCSGLFLFLFFVLFPASSFASHSWGGYHWARTSNPFVLKLGANVSTTWKPYLSSVANDWSLSGVLDTTVVSGGAGNPKSCKATIGRVEVCSQKYGNNGWLGIAQIWISSSHITQGTVRVNDTYFTTSKYNTAAWRNLVMCQEVGHTLGLDHVDETFNNYNLGTCMDYTNFPAGGVQGSFDYGPSNEHPGGTVAGDSDYEELLAIYSHLDSTTSVKQSAARMPMVAETGPARLGTGQWGRLIRSGNHGRTELFELNLGRGNRVLTHVIWAEPEE